MKKLMLGLMMAFAATAAMAEDYVAEVISADGSVKGYASLQVALGAVDSAGAAFTNTVRLICDVTENVSLSVNMAAILDLNGWTLTGDGTKSVITITSGSALTLTDSSAKQTGTVTMPKGAQGPSFGGGVYNNGTFTLSGGTITGCTAKMYGGGVFDAGGSTFTLSGGTIAGCAATQSGGGVYNGGMFTLSGGTIAGCTAQRSGGVYNTGDGTFTLLGGTIAGCTAKMNGGGVNNAGTFTLSGGTITGCTATQSGGGVNNGGTFTMTGGTIADCTATQDGGGVDNGKTFAMTGGSISGCEATQGGGVFNGKTFAMTGGSISGCEATQNGGGVNNNNGTFTLSGGTITGCKATSSGGGVYNTGDSTFTPSGGAVENAIAKSGTKNPSISGGLFGKEVVGDGKFPMWLASGAETAGNPDAATTNVYPSVVRGNTNCVLMVRMEGLLSVVVSNGTEAVAGYPAADYRIFEVVSNATVSLAYVPAEGRELKEGAPTTLTVDEDMVVYPVKSLGPTCDGGTIEKDKEIGWVVTPTNGATKVVITGLAEGETVAGVRLGKFVVPSGAFDGFGEDGKTFSISLDETGEVTIGTETIPVQPTIGKGVENPFVLGEGDDGMLVAVTVMAIPGLQYTLWREGKAALLGGTDGWTDRPASAVAGATTVKLVDNKPPKGQAFYRITVSVP